MVPTASDIQTTPFGAPPRPLTEDVLQSAAETVLANPAPVETLQDGEFLSAPEDREPGPGPHPGRLARIVGERPLECALAALLAGALMAALVKLALKRRRH